MFENDIRFKEAISHFGEKASYQWLALNGDEWIELSNKTIDLDFLSDLKKGNIRNVKYQISVPKSGSKTKCLVDISELRIGNLVKIKTSNDAAYYPIYAIDGMGLKVVLGGVRRCEGWKDIDLLKPIQLTHELLEWIGFTFSHGGIGWHTYKIDSISLSVVPTKNKILLLGYLINGNYRYIQYFHELQNFYYVLSGKELTENLYNNDEDRIDRC